MVNVDQQHNLQRQTKNNTGNVLTAMTYWYRYVVNVDVKNH